MCERVNKLYVKVFVYAKLWIKKNGEILNAGILILLWCVQLLTTLHHSLHTFAGRIVPLFMLNLYDSC